MGSMSEGYDELLQENEKLKKEIEKLKKEHLEENRKTFYAISEALLYTRHYDGDSQISGHHWGRGKSGKRIPWYDHAAEMIMEKYRENIK